VAKHFLDEYEKILEKRPTIVVGNPGTESYLPMEVCFICPGQPAKMKVFKEESANIFRLRIVFLNPREKLQLIQTPNFLERPIFLRMKGCQ